MEYDPTLWAARDAGRRKRLEAKLKRQARPAAGKNALTDRRIGVKIYSARDRFLAREKAMGAHEPY